MSATVTVEVHVARFPLLSSTVSITVFAPTSVHPNADWDKLSVLIAQLSELPLFTSAEVIVALPAPSSTTEISWQVAVGGMVSNTVTVPVQVAVFPLLSSTVRVTVFAPTFAQVKAEIFKLKLLMLQLSELPLSTFAATIEALPVPSR